MRGLLGVNEPADGLVDGVTTREEDDEHDDDSGQVLRPVQAVWEAVGRRAAPQQKCRAQRDGGKGITHVVHGVGQQGDRPGEHHQYGLNGGGNAQNDQRDKECPHARARIAQVGIHSPMCVVVVLIVGVADAHRAQCASLRAR